jgi:hypothetical protein
VGALGYAEIGTGAIIAAVVFFLAISEPVRMAALALVAAVAGQVIGTWLGNLDANKMYTGVAVTGDWVQLHLPIVSAGVIAGVGAAVAMILKRKS